MNGDQSSLEKNQEFQAMPRHMRQWILMSPNATRDFAEFFESGGRIQRVEGATPYYSPTQPPEIVVGAEHWRQIQKPDANPYAARHMFATMAHEVGHHHYNTGKSRFPGGNQEDYIQYRSEIEANAIFNAFPIIRDLQKGGDPYFRGAPLGSVGYLGDMQLAPIWSAWSKGEIDDRTAVERIASPVAATSSKLSYPPPPPDLDGDGRVTHRDAYIRDYQQLIKARPELSQRPEEHEQPELKGSQRGGSSAGKVSPADPDHPDHAMLERIRTGVGDLDQSVGKSWDEASGRVSRALLATCKDDRERYAERGEKAFAMATNALDRIDHVMPSRDGRYLCAVQGGVQDPAHKVAVVEIAQAIQIPVEVSDAKVEAARTLIAQEQALARQQELTRGIDDPARGTNDPAQVDPTRAM